MPASSRSAMRRSSASAPIAPGCWPCTASSTSRCSRWSSPGLAAMVLGFVTSFLVMRGVDLTRLMVTLGIALLLEALAERFSNITGGTDGLQGIEMQPILGLFAFDMFGKTGFFYSPDRAVRAVPAGAAHRAFAVRPVAARDQEQSAARRRDRHSRQPPPDRDLHAGRVLCRHRRRAVHPDHGARLARRVLVRALRRPDAGAGHRRHRLSLWRPDRRGRVQAAAGRVLDHHAAILAVLDRPRAGRDRAGRPRAHASLGAVAAQPRSSGSSPGARPSLPCRESDAS